MRNLLLIILMFLVVSPAIAKEDKEKKGHGAGGVRDDHASEMGIEKGNAWAGAKEKKVKEDSEEAGEGKQNKEKKQKKVKKVKKEKKAKK